MRPSLRGLSDAPPSASPPLSPHPDLSRGRLPGGRGHIVVRDLIRGYWTTRGARVEHYTLHSRLLHRELHEIRVVPAKHGDWTLVFLHGRSAGPSSNLSQLFDALHDLGDRADGRWGSMVLDKIVPRHGRVAIGGISMGGYGALLLGAQRHLCAVGGHSPALWFSGADSAAGALDDAEDYAGHDIVNHPPHYSEPVWIDVGTEDPFQDAVVHYAHEVHAQLHVWSGGHDSDYWHSHMRQYFAFYARHCA